MSNHYLNDLVRQIRNDYTADQLVKHFLDRTPSVARRFKEIGAASNARGESKPDHVLIWDGYDIAVGNKYAFRDVSYPGTEGRRSNWE